MPPMMITGKVSAHTDSRSARSSAMTSNACLGESAKSLRATILQVITSDKAMISPGKIPVKKSLVIES